MAGRADTYLNYHLFFHLLFYFLFEKLVHRSGTYRKEFVSHGNADAFLTFTHTEGSRKFDAAAEIVFGHKLLQSFNHHAGALNVAGRTDTYRYFHKSSSYLQFEQLLNFSTLTASQSCLPHLGQTSPITPTYPQTGSLSTGWLIAP